MMPRDGDSFSVGDAIPEGFVVICDADEGALDACEAEGLILQVFAFLVDACEGSVWRNARDVGLGVEEDFIDGLRAVCSGPGCHIVQVGGVRDGIAPVLARDVCV